MSSTSTPSQPYINCEPGVQVGDKDHYGIIPAGTGQAGEPTKAAAAGTFAAIVAGNAATGLGYVRVRMPRTAAQIAAGTAQGTAYRLVLADDAD